MGRLFYIDGIIFHGDGRPYFLDDHAVGRQQLGRYSVVRVRDQPSLMNPGYLPGKLMRAYLRAAEPVYQRNGLTFDKIGYYYPSY